MGILFGASLTLSAQKRFPKTEEIQNYVIENEQNVINEYSEFVKDSIGEFYFYPDNLENYVDTHPAELGVYRHMSRQATINNQEKYLALEKKYFKKIEISASTNAFVKGVMIHELSHNYFNELIIRLLEKKVPVNRYYKPQFGLTIPKSTYGSEFIQEGFCEYIAYKMGEIIISGNIPSIKSIEELESKKESYEIKYVYSVYFLKDFFDRYGIRQGHRILVTNPPPTDEEILNPELFFQRLKDTRPLNSRVEFILEDKNSGKIGINNNQKPLN